VVQRLEHDAEGHARQRAARILTALVEHIGFQYRHGAPGDPGGFNQRLDGLRQELPPEPHRVEHVTDNGGEELFLEDADQLRIGHFGRHDFLGTQNYRVNAREISGTKVISSKATISARYMPSDSRMNSPTLTRVILHTTSITVPTGGVSVPMERLMIRMMPKCTGSMPAARTVGIRIGTRTIIKAVPSLTVPSSRNITFITRSSMIGSRS